jgi:hypothetical protein
MKRDDDGHPVVDASSTGLGVRPGEIPDTAGMVFPGRGGMSVTPDDPEGLPRWRRPPPLGGTATHPVWEISEDNLPADLLFREDPDSLTHGFIEPRTMMPIEHYEALLGETRLAWREHT